MHIIKPQESSIVEERSKFLAAEQRNLLVFLVVDWPIYFLHGKGKIDMYVQICIYFIKQENMKVFYMAGHLEVKSSEFLAVCSCRPTG